jgi:hypothetical protein
MRTCRTPRILSIPTNIAHHGGRQESQFFSRIEIQDFECVWWYTVVYTDQVVPHNYVVVHTS